MIIRVHDDGSEEEGSERGGGGGGGGGAQLGVGGAGTTFPGGGALLDVVQSNRRRYYQLFPSVPSAQRRGGVISASLPEEEEEEEAAAEALNSYDGGTTAEGALLVPLQLCVRPELASALRILRGGGDDNSRTTPTTSGRIPCLDDPPMAVWEAELVADAVSRNPHLDNFDLEMRVVADPRRLLPPLAKAISTHPGLRQVWLEHNNLDDDCAYCVARMLDTTGDGTNSSSLEKLSLSMNDIGDAGAAAIAGSLRTNTSLKEIFLGLNRIGDRGCAALASMVKVNSTLTLLWVDGNVGVTSRGCRFIESAMRHSNYALESVDTEDCCTLELEQDDDGVGERINAICRSNVATKKKFDKFQSTKPYLPLELWPLAMEAFQVKPDLLLEVVKSRPDYVFERAGIAARSEMRRRGLIRTFDEI